MIDSISLENWRSHESTSLKFRNGTNLLVGIMGSGKSSVLDAACFALFGTFPALERRRLSLGEVIRHGKDYAKVSLVLDWKGERYELIRTISKDRKGKASSEGEVRKAGKLVEKGQSATTKYVEHLLQADYDLFSRAIYSEQNRIDHFLNIDPAKRKVEMDELLGLDRFETARGNAVTLINRARSARTALEGKFDKRRLEEIRKKEKEASERLASLESTKKTLAESAENSKSLLEVANASFKTMKSKKEKADSLNGSISKSKGAIDALKRELSGKETGPEALAKLRESKSAAEKALSEARIALLKSEQAQNAISRETGAAESRLEAAKTAKAGLGAVEKELSSLLGGKTPDELAAEKSSAEKETLSLSASCKSLSSEITKLEEGMRGMKPGLSSCPVCRCSLTDDGIKHVLEEYRGEISKKNSELASAKLAMEQKTKSLSQFEISLRKADMLSQKKRMLEKEASALDALQAGVPKMKEEAKKAAALAQAVKMEMEKASAALASVAQECKIHEELLSRGERLAQVASLLAKSERELVSLAFSEKEFEASRKELEERRLAAERISSELNSVIAQLRDAKDFLSLAAAERAEMESTEKEAARLLKLEEELSIYRNALLETQASLRQEVIEAINSAMNGIWQLVYPYRDYRGLRLAADEKGYAFEIYDSEWRPAELASGGERASIALAFRIALASVLTPNMSLLVLDEPTHNLDKEAVAVLAHALQDNLPELVEQSFIITHDEGLMGSEFASTYRLGRDKGSNAGTKAEEI